MKKTEIVDKLKTLVQDAETTQVRSMLNLTTKILEMSPRRIEGYISLITGIADLPVHNRSSEKLGIFKRKNRKKVNS